MPSSRATSVTVRPDERTSSIASRLYSSEYRFVYLLPTWHYFLWNLSDPSLQVSVVKGKLQNNHDKGGVRGGRDADVEQNPAAGRPQPAQRRTPSSRASHPLEPGHRRHVPGTSASTHRPALAIPDTIAADPAPSVWRIHPLS
ncbi:hypothetical protein GCM10027073_43850 [Streptomyces chlorus]